MIRKNGERRPYDIVLYGATGFVGRLTAEYLAAHAPDDCRWALAGRDLGRLEKLRESLCEISPACATLPLLHAEATDTAALRTLAESAHVVASTVGPYLWYGEGLVAACAEAGTDYADLCGESEFVDRMYVQYDARARETGARLLHSCAFDCVPQDLGAYFTVARLPEDVPLRVDAFVRTNAYFSGGTFASTANAMSRGAQATRAAKERRLHEPRLVGRRAHAAFGAPHFSKETGLWALPLPTLDPQIVARSAAALDRYGPDFRYRAFAGIRSTPLAVGAPLAAGAALAVAQLPAARRWLLGRYGPGEGPDAERRRASWFSVRFVGSGGGRRVFTEVSGGDPGYDETSKMLSHTVLSLVHDDLPETSGQVTTAVAMGDALLARLQQAGLRFRVVDAR